MDSLNPVEIVAGLVIKGIVLGVILAISIPISRLLMGFEYKGYKKIRRLIKGSETIEVPAHLMANFQGV